MGTNLDLQVPHRRLIGFVAFRDGLQIRIAGRHAAPIFRVADPLMIAAIAHGAWAKSAAEPLPRVYAVDPFDSWETIGAGSVRSG
jgi:hypothetical protein